VDVAVDPAGGEDAALAGDDLRAGADDDVDSGWTSGLPALPMAWMRPSRKATSALTMPQWSRISALVMTVSTAPSARGDLGLAHAVADHLAAAELDLLAVYRAVLFDLDDEVGVGEAHAVADVGPVHGGVGRARHAERHCSEPPACADEGVSPRYTTARRRRTTRVTARAWPGTTRTAGCPAGYARSRKSDAGACSSVEGPSAVRS
jgi:hypothetical protein